MKFTVKLRPERVIVFDECLAEIDCHPQANSLAVVENHRLLILKCRFCRYPYTVCLTENCEYKTKCFCHKYFGFLN